MFLYLLVNIRVFIIKKNWKVSDLWDLYLGNCLKSIFWDYVLYYVFCCF